MRRLVELVACILAAFRLARLVTEEEGPGGMFTQLRAGLGAYDYGQDGQPQTNLGRGISCPHCVGVWAAALMVAVWRVSWLHPVVLWLAVAGGQSVLQDWRD